LIAVSCRQLKSGKSQIPEVAELYTLASVEL